MHLVFSDQWPNVDILNKFLCQRHTRKFRTSKNYFFILVFDNFNMAYEKNEITFLLEQNLKKEKLTCVKKLQEWLLC